jgi:hypothetical protein
MIGLHRARIAERAFGKDLAQQWLYRDPTAEYPQSDLTAWRATCYHDSVLELEQTANPVSLMLEWQKAFDATINDVRDFGDFSVTRAVILADIWCGADFEGPAFLLARTGDIVIVQPSPFIQYPLSIIPQTGPAFCAKPDQLRVFEKIYPPVSGAMGAVGATDA